MRKIFPLLTCVILTGCATGPSLVPDDSALIGTWVIQHDVSGFDYSVIEYTSGGDKCEIETSFEGAVGFEITLYWNKWQLRDSVVYTIMHATNSSIPPGRAINDKVLTLTDTEFNALMIEPAYADSATEVHFRHPTAESGKVCSVVMRVLSPGGLRSKNNAEAGRMKPI